VRITNTTLRRQLAVVMVGAALVVAGCADNDTTPGGASGQPSPPAAKPPSPGAPQQATVQWVDSTCQALRPAFDQLGTPPQLDVNDLAATRQAYLTYLGNARNATQQAIERLTLVGVPPVAHGQQVLDQTRNQLIQLRHDLDDAVAQLNRADPNDAGAVGLAVGAAGNVMGALDNRVQVLAALAHDPQLRAAINQTPECQKLIWPASTNTQPTTSRLRPPAKHGDNAGRQRGT
jgi:hypothetical protein